MRTARLARSRRGARRAAGSSAGAGPGGGGMWGPPARTPPDPVPFMGSPVGIRSLAERLVDQRMDAILSIDTTKGNRIINARGFAISPTVKEGYILRVSEDLLRIMEITTGRRPLVFAIT